jgi:F-type H+-transporting ATPase subunit b
MGELTVSLLAAEEGGGQSNFLVPNGTFFAVLLIFLITLGVIAKWVVPPVGKVLAAREAMLAKTAADNRKSAEQVAAAQDDYDKTMAGARSEASSIRDEARNAGRKAVDEKRAEASEEVAETVRQADTRLSDQRADTQTQLQSSVDGLSATLASRILGVDVKSGGSQ